MAEMKHSMLNPEIDKARVSSLEKADKLRNTPHTGNTTRVPQTDTQGGQKLQEMQSENQPTADQLRNLRTKLPGTSVRLMQQKSKSMSCDTSSPSLQENPRQSIDKDNVDKTESGISGNG